MNSNVHVAKMVPTAGLEPAQIAPLAPQTSASTNFATSACQWPYGQTFNGVRFANPDNAAALRADKKIHCRINDLRLNNPGRSPYCGVVAGAGGRGCLLHGRGRCRRSRGLRCHRRLRRCRRGEHRPLQHAGGFARRSRPHVGQQQNSSRRTVPRTPPSTWRTTCWYHARRTRCPTPRNRSRPPPPAPLPRCISTRPMIINANSTWKARIKPRNIRNLSVANAAAAQIC